MSYIIGDSIISLAENNNGVYSFDNIIVVMDKQS